MSTYDPRTPLENGTVLRTMDGKTFHILRFTAAGGNALLYAARLDGSALDVTLKEIFPAGCTRVDGLAADPALGAPDAPEAMRKSFYDRLARQAQKELEMTSVCAPGLCMRCRIWSSWLSARCCGRTAVRSARHRTMLPRCPAVFCICPH